MLDLFIHEVEGRAKAELEQFKAFGKHFSHDHPLSLINPIEEDEEEDDKSCSICGLPILSSPYYNCSAIPCKFFLHHQCALNLPSYLRMPTYCNSRLTGHNLFLWKAKQSLSSSSSDFNYECSYCSIEIHPLSAGAGVEIEIKHRSHPSHPLVATHKEVSCECDGCGREHKGFFFTCSKGCNFWIHRDCTLLPNIITLLDQPYPFFLVYSPYQISDKHCVVCRKPLLGRSSNLGLYLCPQSGRFAHVPCGNQDKSASKTTSEVTMRLPEEERDEFPSRVIRRYAETIVGTSTDDDRQTIESCHKQHPLILIINNTDSNNTTNTKKKNKRKVLLACDLCTQPIDTSSSSPFHRCRDTACQFAAHKICADILPGITKSFFPGTLVKEAGYSATNHLGTPVFFNSVFYCHFCGRPCNGAYTHFSPLSGARFRQPLHIDLECMAAPITVNHASHSHPQHILFRPHSSPSVGDATPALALSCCTADSLYYDIYRCLACNYSIHISCAMLPKRVHFPQYHRRHPLCLIYGNIDGHDFCEVCEEVIDLRYWMYRCVECDESYHINCIPSVGYLSKVKFGGILTLPSSVHVHPLTLERMLDVPSQRCGNCKEIIHGRVDEMAFFCSLCHFWLHFSCAGKSASDPLPLYSYVRLQDDRSNLKSHMIIRLY